MSTLIDDPAPVTPALAGWVRDAVYQIEGNPAPDVVTGHAADAPFSGLGVANVQAQALANRTSLLHNAVRNFTGAFIGQLAGPAGYIKLPVLGGGGSGAQVIATVQWGRVIRPSVAPAFIYSEFVTLPTPFTVALFAVLPTPILQQPNLNVSPNVFVVSWVPLSVGNVSELRFAVQPTPGGIQQYGFSWWAVGV